MMLLLPHLFAALRRLHDAWRRPVCVFLLSVLVVAPASALPATPPPGSLESILSTFDHQSLTRDGSVVTLRAPQHAPMLRAPAAPPARVAATDDAWDDRFGLPGVTCCTVYNYRVLTIQVAGSDVYAGGEFNEMGGQASTRGIARWDGRRWAALGGGLREESRTGKLIVYDMAVSGDDLYVVGTFDGAGELSVPGMARWNIPTQTWHPVGNGAAAHDEVGFATGPTSVAVDGNEVYIGGTFYSIYSVDVYNVTRWDGTQWASLDGGVFDIRDPLNDTASVSDIVIAGDLVYIGGRFANARNESTTLPVNNIAAWSRSTGRWAALDGGASAGVFALAVDGATLYAGGDFTSAGGQQINRIARWDGAQWSPLGSGAAAFVDELTFAQGALYASGTFFEMGGVPNTNSIARWDGTQWQSLRSDLLLSNPQEDLVLTVGVLPNGTIIAGGVFSNDGIPLFNHVAAFDGTTWHGTGLGLDDDPNELGGASSYAVAVNTAGQVFVSGGFTTLGGLPFNHIAMWDGVAWHDIGGVDGSVYTMVIRGDTLYVGGNFTQIGGISAPQVAQYTMSSGAWATLGAGLPDGTVYALAFAGDTLYAGGGAFGGEDCCLWKFDGTTWSTFSQRFRTDLFVSGVGTQLFQTTVRALASDGRYLLVGGYLLDLETRADDQKIEAGDLFVYDTATDSISLFIDGTRVGADRGNVPAAINAITYGPGGVYVGGKFSSIAGVPASNIARVNESGWATLGAGILGNDSSVNALARNGNDLYVGGSFDTAGVQASNVARWDSAAGQWAALGCGTSGSVGDLAVQPLGSPNAALYVAGGISAAGCKPSEGFAVWYGVGPGGVTPGALDKRLFLPLLLR